MFVSFSVKNTRAEDVTQLRTISHSFDSKHSSNQICENENENTIIVTQL